LGQHARVGAGIAGMSFGAIAGDHHQRVGDHLVDRFLRVTENHHKVRGVGIVQFIETFLGEAFSRVGKQQAVIADAQLFLPAGVEER